MISIKMQQTIRLIGFVSIFLSANAHAIALGEIQVYSTQLQPLQLQVELIEVEGVLPNSMAARVAGPAQFLAAGLLYQAWYAQLDVNIVNNAGSYALVVEGQLPVEQSQLDFIFEVDYLGGQLSAEYAVSLPTFLASTTADELTSKQATTESQVEVTSLNAEVVLEAAVAQLVANQNTTSELVVEVFLRVKPGQTLWGIAVKNSPQGINPWQTLIGLYRANPESYKNGDIRQVMANSRLRLPTAKELDAVSVEQAKLAYNTLVPAPKKVAAKVKEKVKPKQPLAKSTSISQLVTKQEDKLKGLSNQSELLQSQVDGLQDDYSVAMSEQKLLAKTSKNLAQGVISQKQDIQSLNAQKSQLESNMRSLDHKFEATQLNLNQAKQDLTEAQQALIATEQELDLAAQVKVRNQQDEKWKQWVDMGKQWGFLLVPVLLFLGFMWLILGRNKKTVTKSQESPKVADEQEITLDPLADNNNTSSAKVAGLRDGAKKMQGGIPERSFIEELLQQQEQDEAQLARQGFNAQIDDDQLHLSNDVQAMLTGQKQMLNQANEPVDYLSHEEEMDTKLDLALSYRDMGEIAQAQAILQQVLHQGNACQQTQVRILLSSISKV